MDVDLFRAAETIGIIAFAVSGGYAAVRAQMDWIGVIVLSIVVAVGGGTLRDVLLGVQPVWWVRAPGQLVVAAVTALVVIAIATWHPQRKPDTWRTVMYADAVGLATFTVTGTSLALAEDVPAWIAVFFGVVSGTGGGVIRDVLVRRRPLILVGEIYAVAAVAGGYLYVALLGTDLSGGVAATSAVVLILAVRAMAMRWHWELPHFRQPSA